jgi:hypothetical protein
MSHDIDQVIQAEESDGPGNVPKDEILPRYVPNALNHHVLGARAIFFPKKDLPNCSGVEIATLLLICSFWGSLAQPKSGITTTVGNISRPFAKTTTNHNFGT